MEGAYVSESFYSEKYLFGRKQVLPAGEFLFWEKKARAFVDLYTFGRIKNNRQLIDEFSDEIGGCLCELSEYLYMNEGNENKQSEGIIGRSTTYIQGVEYRICQRYLFITGLMYRGSK